MSNRISQKDAVVKQVKAILGSSFDPTKPVKELLTKSQIIEVRANVVAEIMAGNIAYSLDISDEAGMATYVAGLVSNHIRKAKELNGGQSYRPETTNAGKNDERLRELSKLLKTVEKESDDYKQISFAILERKTELGVTVSTPRPRKKKEAKEIVIDINALPESLRAFATDLTSQA